MFQNRFSTDKMRKRLYFKLPRKTGNSASVKNEVAKIKCYTCKTHVQYPNIHKIPDYGDVM